MYIICYFFPQADDLYQYTMVSVCSADRMKERIKTIATECAQTIDQMSGPWVINTNGYEKYFCNLLGWTCINGRWADAANKDTHIEIKKGQDSMWFDMVRCNLM